jgi:hypothetical protein
MADLGWNCAQAGVVLFWCLSREVVDWEGGHGDVVVVEGSHEVALGWQGMDLV